MVVEETTNYGYGPCMLWLNSEISSCIKADPIVYKWKMQICTQIQSKSACFGLEFVQAMEWEKPMTLNNEFKREGKQVLLLVFPLIVKFFFLW